MIKTKVILQRAYTYNRFCNRRRTGAISGAETLCKPLSFGSFSLTALALSFRLRIKAFDFPYCMFNLSYHSRKFIAISLEINQTFIVISTATLLKYIMSYLHWLWQSIPVPRIDWMLLCLQVEVLIFIITFITCTAISWLSYISIGMRKANTEEPTSMVIYLWSEVSERM